MYLKKKKHVTLVTRQRTDEQFWKVLQATLYFSRIELRLIIYEKKNDNFVVACRKNSASTKVYIVDI